MVSLPAVTAPSVQWRLAEMPTACWICSQREVQRASGDERGDECGQCGVMPAAFADAGEGGFAETHFELVSEDEADDEFLAVALGAFASGHGGGEDVGWMRWILLPVDVVVVHAADHEGVGERRGDGVDLLAGADDGGGAAAGDLVQNLERDLDVVLLVAAESAAYGIEQEALRLVDGVLRKLFVFQRGGPAGHFGGDGFLA